MRRKARKGKVRRGRTDEERLDLLEGMLGSYTGKVICRWSSRGRGWRLHETREEGASGSVREAVDVFLDAEGR